MNIILQTSHSTDLIIIVSQSDLFIRYRQAFREATGRLLRLTHDDNTALPYPCLRVPVKMEGQLLGFLSVDPFRTTGSKNDPFDVIANRMLDGGATPAQLRAARKAYDHLPVVSDSLSHAIETMLEIFAIQLGDFAERAFLQSVDNEPPTIRKAREYILDRLSEELTLDEVATHAGVSPFHFCKVFKKATGHTFTEFVTKARIEQAKRLLMRPQMRVTEVAYDVGFQSLSQFNRSFKKVTAQSPTEYRGTNGPCGRLAA